MHLINGEVSKNTGLKEWIVWDDSHLMMIADNLEVIEYEA